MLQWLDHKGQTSTARHKPLAAAAAAVASSAEKNRCGELKTKWLFICRFLSRGEDTRCRVAQLAVLQALLSILLPPLLVLRVPCSFPCSLLCTALTPAPSSVAVSSWAAA